jgi:hypothetical protein
MASLYSPKPRTYVDSDAYCEALWMRVASVHSQAEHDAIGQLMGPTGSYAFLNAERLADDSWQWRDGTPWDFEAWEPGQPDNSGDQEFLTIKWQPGTGVVWHDMPDNNGVICEAASISAISGTVTTILRLGGTKNAAKIAADADL